MKNIACSVITELIPCSHHPLPWSEVDVLFDYSDDFRWFGSHSQKNIDKGSKL